MTNLTEAGATGSNAQASKKKKTAAKTAKLKSSAWYQGAVRSIGITRERLSENCDELENQAATSSARSATIKPSEASTYTGSKRETGNEIASHQTLDRHRRS